MAKKRKNSNYKPKTTVQAPVQENRRSGTTKLSTRAKILLPVSAVLLIGAYILSSKATSGEGTMAIVSYALMALGCGSMSVVVQEMRQEKDSTMMKIIFFVLVVVAVLYAGVTASLLFK